MNLDNLYEYTNGKVLTAYFAKNQKCRLYN